MANSLEVRVPLLDHTLVEWAARLPPALKLHRGEGKYVLKSALEPYVPQDILYRRKQGFAVPLAAWFRGPLRERLDQVSRRAALRDTGLFEMGFVERLIERHLEPLGLGQRLLELTRWLRLRDENLPAEPAAVLAAELGQPLPDPSNQAPRASRRDGARSAARAPAGCGGEG